MPELDPPPELEALLYRAFDAARTVLEEGGVVVERGAMFVVTDDGGRLGASFPSGDSLASSTLALEAANAYSVKSALEDLRRFNDDTGFAMPGEAE